MSNSRELVTPESPTQDDDEPSPKRRKIESKDGPIKTTNTRRKTACQSCRMRKGRFTVTIYLSISFLTLLKPDHETYQMLKHKDSQMRCGKAYMWHLPCERSSLHLHRSASGEIDVRKQSTSTGTRLTDARIDSATELLSNKLDRLQSSIDRLHNFTQQVGSAGAYMCFWMS